MTNDLRIEYIPLKTLQKNARNPKSHDLGSINLSVSRFGFVAPIILDERTQTVVAGHGRIDTLLDMQRQKQEPPERVIAQNGDWLVPVVRGVTFDSEEARDAYTVADNRTTILGGWNDEQLAEVLQELANGEDGLLEVSGYDGDDIEAILRDIDLANHIQFQEYDESIADSVEWNECPNCGHKWPK